MTLYDTSQHCALCDNVPRCAKSKRCDMTGRAFKTLCNYCGNPKGQHASNCVIANPPQTKSPSAP